MTYVYFTEDFHIVYENGEEVPCGELYSLRYPKLKDGVVKDMAKAGGRSKQYIPELLESTIYGYEMAKYTDGKVYPAIIVGHQGWPWRTTNHDGSHGYGMVPIEWPSVSSLSIQTIFRMSDGHYVPGKEKNDIFTEIAKYRSYWPEDYAEDKTYISPADYGWGAEGNLWDISEPSFWSLWQSRNGWLPEYVETAHYFDWTNYGYKAYEKPSWWDDWAAFWSEGYYFSNWDRFVARYPDAPADGPYNTNPAPEAMVVNITGTAWLSNVGELTSDTAYADIYDHYYYNEYGPYTNITVHVTLLVRNYSGTTTEEYDIPFAEFDGTNARFVFIRSSSETGLIHVINIDSNDAVWSMN